MSDEKRFFIAIALSLTVLMAFQAYTRKYQKAYPAKPVSPTVIKQEKVEKTSEPVVQPAKENLVEINTDSYYAILTDNGAAIKELYIKKFKDKNGKPILLAKQVETRPLTLSTYYIHQTEQLLWKLIALDKVSATYQAETENWLVTKKMSFHNPNYSIELEMNIRNIYKSQTPNNIKFKIIGGVLADPGNNLDIRYMGADVGTVQKIYREAPSARSMQGGKIFSDFSVKWVSSRGKYFAFVLKPHQAEGMAFVETAKDKKNIYSGIISEQQQISKEPVVLKYTLYAGPYNSKAISSIGVTADEVVNYGKLSGMVKLLFVTLEFSHKICRNYGLAIILLSVLISLVMFPLTKKSIVSMQAMQKINPETERIRKEYASNPQKMNKEIMELYKKHKINPMSGCFPMLLQFPVFIALYQVLSRSLALRGAKFLWIKDLSEADAFKTMPVSLPIMANNINILPVLMGIAMVIQQKMSQGKGQAVSEQQRMMLILMPIMFVIFFYNMPSGLVLYWLVNTLFMIAAQKIIFAKLH